MLATGLILLISLAGCLDALGGPDGPLTVIDAYRVSWPEALAFDDSANLVGFIGHEGPAPSFVGGLLAQYVVDTDTSHDDQRGDGRAYAWALLFATSDGGLIRSVVQADPATIETEWVSEGPDGFLRDLWGLNLGGRLRIDTPTVMDVLRDPTTDTGPWLAANRGPTVAYASTVVPVEGMAGIHDLVHEVYFGYGPGSDGGYARYAQVTPATGIVVIEGEEKPDQVGRTVTLIDETFTLGPLPPPAPDPHELPQTVRDATLTLEADGIGEFGLSVHRDDTLVLRLTGRQFDELRTYERSLDTLLPGSYTLTFDVTGTFAMHLVIEGWVGL